MTAIDCERCERLQEQIDDAREELLEAGISGFGALTEGIARLAKQRRKRHFGMLLGQDDIQRVVDGLVNAEKYLIESADNRKNYAFKLEIMRIVTEHLANAIGLDPWGVCKDVEDAVMALLKEVVRTKENKEE